MEHNSIKKNAVLNIVYNILNIIFPLITFPYVSRVLQAERLGKVTFFSTVANYAVMLASLGISTYGIRSVSRVRDNKQELSKTAFELLIINTVATALVLLAMLGSTALIHRFSTEPVLLTINCILIFMTPFGMNWLYSGLEQYGYITKRSIIVKLISLALVFLLVKGKDDYCVYAAIVSFSTVGAYIFNFVYSRKYISFRNLGRLGFKRHYKPMLVLFASSLAVSVYVNLDTIMLGFINGDEQVGLYTVAVKVKSMLLIVVNAISTVLLPRLSYYLVNNKRSEYKRILQKSISTIAMISLPLVAFFIVEAKDSILFLGGEEYLNATTCMIIIMPILLISGFSNITGNQILIPMGNERYFMIAVVSGAVIDLGLNAVLMPPLGCVGAAIATLVAECAQLTIQVYCSREYVLPAIQWKSLTKIALSTAISISIIIVLRTYVVFRGLSGLFVLALTFFSAYGISLLLLKESVLFEFIHGIKKGNTL